MPVLPEVGSRMVWPGAISAVFLGALDHRARHAVLDRAGRVVALELDVDADAGLGLSLRSSTSGVFPIACTMSPYLPPHGRLSRRGSSTSESVVLPLHRPARRRCGSRTLDPKEWTVKAALALVVAALALAVPAGAAAAPTPGAPGLDDRLFPTLGNGGYDGAPLPPRPALCDQRAGSAARRHRHDRRPRHAVPVAIQPGLRRGERRVGLGQPPPCGLDQRGRGARDHAEARCCGVRKAFVVRVSHYVAVPEQPDPEDFSTGVLLHRRTAPPRRDSRISRIRVPVERPPARQGELQLPLDVPSGLDRGRQRAADRGTASGPGALPGPTCSGSRWRPSSSNSRSASYDLIPRGRHDGVTLRDVDRAPPLTERRRAAARARDRRISTG